MIEDDVFVASHVVISGFCRVGRWSYLGVNSSVRDGLSLTEDCVIGAGAVVVKPTDSRQVYVGNPGRATGRDSFSVFTCLWTRWAVRSAMVSFKLPDAGQAIPDREPGARPRLASAPERRVRAQGAA